jgi:nucleotide-binding universal stress UspA family protein
MRVLLPTDRSANANHALNYALNLFKDEEVTFVLFQAFDVPVYTDMPMPIEEFGSSEIEKVLAKDAQELNARFGNTKFKFEALVEAGSLSFNISELVNEQKVDMIVMGTKGASGLAASIIGTNTADAIQASTCPLIAVPEVSPISGPKNILFATDNKGLTNGQILLPMMDLARKFGAKIHLMNVLDEGKMTTVDEAVAGLKLNNLLEGIDHDFHFENSNDKAGAIERFVETHNIDMLASIPRKSHFFDSIFHRSVTRRLALHSKVPLLVMHDLGN